VRVHYIAQRSDAWRALRCGVFTASRSQDVLARGRYGAESASRRHYKRQIVCEILTGIPEDRAFQSRAMRRGRELEGAARAAYVAHTGVAVETSGFVMHDELAAGCSLDGHVAGFEGVLEIKAPNTATHLRYLFTRRVPRRYLSQITHHLWITGARWCDFVSYDDRLPARMQLLVVRVSRDDVDVAGYAREAQRFLDEVRAIVEPLAAMRPLEFFRSAPYDVARHVLSLSTAAVDARKHERPLPRAVWQPVLGGVR
jgi:hypothetical protein